MALVGQAVSEKKIFEIVDGRTTDGRTDDGRTPDHGHPISSPCEPNGSGELITGKSLQDSLDQRNVGNCLSPVSEWFNRPLLYEPLREKTNNLGSDQARHKPGCTITEEG